MHEYGTIDLPQELQLPLPVYGRWCWYLMVLVPVPWYPVPAI